MVHNSYSLHLILAAQVPVAVQVPVVVQVPVLFDYYLMQGALVLGPVAERAPVLAVEQVFVAERAPVLAAAMVPADDLYLLYNVDR